MRAIIQWMVDMSGYIWGTPIIILLFGASLYFTITCKFVQMRHLKHQFSLLSKVSDRSTVGISPFETFCNTVAYRVGAANIAGVAVAVLAGGPGAVVWMLISSVANAALSYAENSLGQVYKVEKDGVYTGGAYYYMNLGMGWKILPIIFGALTVICIPLLAPAPHASNVAGAFNTAFGIPKWVIGLAVGAVIFTIISGGIKRIARVATIIVPFMTLLYLGITIIILCVHIAEIPNMLYIMLSSAFGWNALYGALLGSAVLWGVKRSVNSSGAGMAESVGPTSAAEVSHPGETGLVSSLSVFIDVAVCICTGLLILSTDCYNVAGLDGSMLHVGQGAAVMSEYAVAGIADITWTQAAVSTLVGHFGTIIVALCLLFFSVTTNLNHYYQGEIAMRYLTKNMSSTVRKAAVWVLRFMMVFCYFWFAISGSSDMWSVGDFSCGLMVWVNCIVLLIMSPTIIKVHRDYERQRKAGIETPVFNPEKAGIKNADFWMEHNKDKFAEVEAKLAKAEKK